MRRDHFARFRRPHPVSGVPGVPVFRDGSTASDSEDLRAPRLGTPAEMPGCSGVPGRVPFRCARTPEHRDRFEVFRGKGSAKASETQGFSESGTPEHREHRISSIPGNRGSAATLVIRCAGCGVTFDARPHPRLGLPVRCQPCADAEAERLRRIAAAGGLRLIPGGADAPRPTGRTRSRSSRRGEPGGPPDAA